MRIKDLGVFEKIPRLATLILNEDLPALELEISRGWDIEALISLSEWIDVTPLQLALVMEKTRSVQYLVGKGAELNRTGEPAFLLAARYCDPEMMRYLVTKGAKIDIVRRVGGDSYKQAYFGRRFEHFPVIHDLGYDAALHGGETLRSAVLDRQYRVIDFFLQHGADINYREPDMVFPYGSTPIAVAARSGDVEMCRYLVKRGADVTLTDKEGDRPYTIAVSLNHTELSEYFKALEPKDFHDLQNKLHELRSFKLPKKLWELLEGDNRVYDFAQDDFRTIRFFTLVDTIPMKLGRKKALRLSADVDGHDVHIVWLPGSQTVGMWDVEHKELHEVGKFSVFRTLLTLSNG